MTRLGLALGLLGAMAGSASAQADGAKVETLFGGHISMLTTLCEQARADAFDILLAHAQRLGANAVVGIRYDATEIMSGVTEVLCYGTAVVAEPDRG